MVKLMESKPEQKFALGQGVVDSVQQSKDLFILRIFRGQRNVGDTLMLLNSHLERDECHCGKGNSAQVGWTDFMVPRLDLCAHKLMCA